MNKKDLYGLRRGLNALCFGGKLRPIPIVYRKFKKSETKWSIAHYRWNTETGKSIDIHIDKAVKYTPMPFLLLHEMLHQYDREIGGRTASHCNGALHHTKKFKAKLKALHKKLGWKSPPAFSVRN